ncbi:DNA polymerase III subunit alpha, partial [bacterium]|nr:DNA polymerase III subunit alpha [bacterium]
TLAEAKEQEPRLQEMIDSNPQVKRLFEIAERLEGLTRHASKHAAGIVISPEKIDDVLPVYIPAKTDDLVTQYAMTELESLGFLKMDFLGLKTLTVIDRVLKMIQKNNNVFINLDKIPLDDEKTFKLICRGDTSGVFQLESSGLKEVLRKLQPNKFEDIIAVNALYRPGPLGSGMVDDFIERRHGRQKVTYILPELQPVLAETYGVIVYQEQVMKIASVVAGYSLGEADILRRAMGKKKAEVMAEQSAIFVAKAEERKVNGKKAKDLFDLMAYFAGYGFNKSHSAAYALIAYQTAYLKAHYPAEYMAVLLSLEAGNAEKLSFYLDEAKSMGLTILPPDINQSLVDFSVVNGAILFGLQGIKNVGLTALNNIIDHRTKKPFNNLLEFSARVDLRTVNKRVIEHLIFAGAFDTLPGNRAQKTEELAHIMDQAVEQKHALSTGQMGLFSAAPTTDSSELSYTFAARADWTNKEKLEKEKEVVGFYLSAHPLDTYKKQLKRFSFKSFEALLEESRLINTPDDIIVSGCGLLKSKRIINTKKGDRMAFIQLEDYVSKTEIVLFPSVFKKVEQWLDAHEIFVVKGAIETSGATCKILANECVPLELFLEEWKIIPALTLELPHSPTPEMLESLSKTLKNGQSMLNLHFEENGKKLELKTRKKISVNNLIVEKLEEQKIGIKISL